MSALKYTAFGTWTLVLLLQILIRKHLALGLCFSFGNKSYRTPPHFQHRDGKKSSLIRIEFFFFLNDEKS